MDHNLKALPQIISQPYDPPSPGSDARHHGLDFFYYKAHSQGSIAGEAIQAILPGIVAAVIIDGDRNTALDPRFDRTFLSAFARLRGNFRRPRAIIFGLSAGAALYPSTW